MTIEQHHPQESYSKSNGDSPTPYSKSFWNWSVGTICAAIIAFFPLNKAYVDYHVGLAKNVVVIELEALREVIEETQDTGTLSANKIDFLVKAEAARTADTLGIQLSMLKNEPRTPQTAKDIYDLEQRLNRAVNYRDCVFAKRDNCDALRVW